MLEDLNDITSLNEIINKDIFKNIEIYIDYIIFILKCILYGDISQYFK